MKFILNTFWKGKICFLFTPFLMLTLIISVKFFGLKGDTLLPQYLVDFLSIRYSIESLILPLLTGGVFSIAVSLLFDYFNMSHKEKIRLGKFYDGLAYVICNLLMFCAGWFAAWIFTAPFIDFIEPIPGQESALLSALIMTVIAKYFILKVKHKKVKGYSILQ